MTSRTGTLTSSERRALLRRLHPDAGGDVDEFVRVLGAIGPRRGSEDRPGASTRSAATGRLGGGRRQRRRALDRLRAALPRRVPGSRRYAHL